MINGAHRHKSRRSTTDVLGRRDMTIAVGNLGVGVPGAELFLPVTFFFFFSKCTRVGERADVNMLQFLFQ